MPTALQGLVQTELGALDTLDALRPSYLPSLRIGLFANDWWPVRASTITEIEPAWFSGNSVLHALPNWGAPFLIGDLAASEAMPRTWIHDGGPVSSWVFGYYVVNQAGALVWAERTELDGLVMYYAGQVYRVTPQYSLRSRYP